MLLVADASDVVKGTKAPAEKIMTDGCGFINRAAALIICRKLNLASRPTAVQGRIKGAKGLFIIEPNDNDEEPKIWIRKSQDKMTYNYPLDRAHCILDLITVSRHSAPIALSRQSIVILSHNGIPEDLLIDLLIKGLMDEVKPLMDWNSPQAMIALWHAINRIGGVTGSRTQRQVAGRSLAMGLQGREWGHVDVGMEDQDAVSLDAAKEATTSAYSGRNDASGRE
jgi:RNA dependent RNA polymerase